MEGHLKLRLQSSGLERIERKERSVPVANTSRFSFPVNLEKKGPDRSSQGVRDSSSN